MPGNGLPWCGLAAAFLYSSLPLTAQQEVTPWRMHIPVGISAGLGQAQQRNLGGAPYDQGAATLFGVNSGVSAVHRDGWGAAMEAGLLLGGYHFAMDIERYDIWQLTGLLEARAWRAFHLVPRKGSDIHVGMAYGLSLVRDQVVRGRSANIFGEWTSDRGMLPYLAPEAGLSTSMGHHHLELVVRYRVHLMERPMHTAVLRHPVGIGFSEATGDHLALVLRKHFGLRKPPPPAALELPDHGSRTTDSLAQIGTKRERMPFVIRSLTAMPGDSLTILLNGLPLLVGHPLEKPKKGLRTALRKGNNELLFVAHGTPPGHEVSGTCTLQWSAAWDETVIFRVSSTRNQAIHIKLE